MTKNDLVYGKAEYWRDEFDILDIEDEMMGNEYDIARKRLGSIFGF